MEISAKNKSWSKKELKYAYNVSGPTLLTWLLRIPGFMNDEFLKKTRKFTPLQSQIIFEHLGQPS